MPPRRYQRIRHDDSGIVFVFAYDRTHPELLHIWARHLVSPSTAIDTFFEGGRDTTWNERRQRYETYSIDHGLYWFWLDPERAVMVISCFRQ
jgi:hypothetical protein